MTECSCNNNSSGTNIIQSEVISPFSVGNNNECHVGISSSPTVRTEAEFDLNDDDFIGLETLFLELNEDNDDHHKIIEPLFSKSENDSSDYDSDDDLKGLEPLFSEYPSTTDKYTGKLTNKINFHGYELSKFFYKKTKKVGGKVVLVDDIKRLRGDVFISYSYSSSFQSDSVDEINTGSVPSLNSVSGVSAVAEVNKHVALLPQHISCLLLEIQYTDIN